MNVLYRFIFSAYLYGMNQFVIYLFHLFVFYLSLAKPNTAKSFATRFYLLLFLNAYLNSMPGNFFVFLSSFLLKHLIKFVFSI